MDKQELDRLWQIALHESVQDGEQFTRYRFAQKIADRCAEIAAAYCVDSDGYDTLCETEHKIKEIFG